MNRRKELFCAVIAIIAFLFISTLQAAAQDESQFKVGDRVEADVNMSSSPEYQSWRKATVVEILMWQGAVSGIRIKTDDGRDITIGARFLRRLSEADKEAPEQAAGNGPEKDPASPPESPSCEFYKDYKKVSDAAPPSAELFKGVIFEWHKSINKYKDFGLVFEDFKMGRPFKNRARGNGRKDVDPAPVGATIYPLKTKLIFCEKDLNLTFRTEWVNEYSCYKSTFGEWVCKNAAPQNYKRTSFPNK